MTSAARARLAIWLSAFAVLAWVPGGFSRFVVAKLLVTAVAVLVGATVASPSRLPRVLAGLMAAGAVAFALAALLGDTPTASLLGRWPRYEGLPVLAVYGASAWLGARLVDGRDRVETMVTAVAAMACTLGAFSVVAAIGWSPTGSSDLVRDGALVGNATDQGLVAMMAVAILARPAWDTLRELYLFGLGGALGTVVLSGSRIALLLTAAVLVGLALRERRALLRPALAVVAGLALVVLLVPQARERLLDASTVRGRLLLWDVALDMVRDRPLLGFGPSRFVDAVGPYETPAWAEWARLDRAGAPTPDSPHSVLLQVWLAGGLPLLLCFAALAALTVRLGVRAVRAHPELDGAAAAVAAYGVAMLANFTIASSTCLAAFLAGAVVCVRGAAKAPPEPVWRRRTAVPVAGLAAAALLVGCVSEVFVQQGMSAAARGDEAAAASAFDRAATLRPGDGDLDFLAAQALATTDPGSATRRARAALAATPDSYEARVTLGLALVRAGERPAAAQVLTGVVADFPRRGLPRRLLQRARD